MIIEEAVPEDAQAILDLQKEAYASEARLYDDFTLPPLLQTLEEICEDFDRQLFLKAVEEGEIVGSVRACLREGTCHIGRLVVRPDLQGRGLGTRLMDEIEGRFSAAERFELFTGHRSEKALHIYGKRGYRVFRSEPVHARLSLVYLQKPGGGA